MPILRQRVVCRLESGPRSHKKSALNKQKSKITQPSCNGSVYGKILRLFLMAISRYATIMAECYKRKIMELLARHPDLSPDQLIQIAKNNEEYFNRGAFDYLRLERKRRKDLGISYFFESDFREMMEEFIKTFDFKM